MAEEIMRITSKGQLTIPASIRKKLSLKEGDYLRVKLEHDEIRLKKMKMVQPLSQDDPIWNMIGVGESGHNDISVNHDKHLAEGEAERWR